MRGLRGCVDGMKTSVCLVVLISGGEGASIIEVSCEDSGLGVISYNVSVNKRKVGSLLRLPADGR